MTRASIAKRVLLQLSHRLSKRKDALTGLPKNPNHALQRWGSPYGGWNVPKDFALSASAVVLSAGVGLDITFDIDLVKKFGCSVHLFDPTPEAIAHVEKVLLAATTQDPHSVCINNQPGAYYALEPTLSSLLHMHPYGLWREETTLTFHKPADSPDISHTASAAQVAFETDGNLELPVKSIENIAQALNIEHIDLLKIDIEGAEYAVIPHLLQTAFRPRMICMEVHEPDLKLNAQKARELLGTLLDAGYEIVWSDLYGNYTLLLKGALS